MARKSRRKNLGEVALESVVVPEVSRERTLVRTAAYARLSADKGDNEKIETQVELLYQFIEGMPELELIDTYVDHGYSGTNFDRPEFIRLMEDVKTGKIHCIVVKDLSRFGRDFLETGYYLETLLPNLNVRFISVNDDYDSIRQSDRESIAVPIKNIINELYAKESSKKQTAYFEMCSKNGTRTIERGTFGYLVDRKENRLVANPETAPYVQLIFRWFLMGYTTGQIAKRLNMVQARTPFYYKAMEEGYEVPDTDQWRCDRVMTILRNRTYAGDTVYGKRRKILYKNVDAYHAKREDWVIHENTHEALISRDDFDKVQEMMDMTGKIKKEAREKKKEMREKFPDYFPQKVCCMVCGLTMVHSRYTRGASGKGFDGAFYECKGNDIRQGCGQRIHEDYLRIIVMDQIRSLVACACDKKSLLKRMQSGECSTGAVLSLRREISDLSAELARKVEARESLYENLIEGVIDSDDYRMLKERYLSEEQKLKDDIAAAQDKKRENNRKLKQCIELVEHLEEYLGRQELDERMAAEFIDKILISPAGKIEVRFTFNDVFADLEGFTKRTV